ncbi:hypothetical protein M9H77_23861 [Catharanthus roseus]|uniref:Uncharacterized protein n=1 Tax=Catharanthus roseus TaxID=4058 RepID=A0ACC0AYM8_CATRO|nr:hypothetical protein M9H77_23861 [Catharanthus roseus]
MEVRLFCNRALVWCIAGIDYEMLPSVALHFLLNLDFLAVLETFIFRRGVLVQVSLKGHCCPGGYAFVFETYSLVPRGMQIPYSAAVDLVVGLGMLLERTVDMQGDNNCFNHLRDRLIVGTPIDVSKIAEVKYPDCDIYIKNVIVSGDLIALPFEGYGMILGMDNIKSHHHLYLTIRYYNWYFHNRLYIPDDTDLNCKILEEAHRNMALA